MYRILKFAKIVVCLILLFNYVADAGAVSIVAESQEERVNEIYKKNEAGTYDVPLSTVDKDGKVIQKNIKVTILFPKSVISEDHQEAIDARDFKVRKNDFVNLDAQNTINIAKARAWNTGTGEQIGIKYVEVSNPKEGSSDMLYATFITEKGTKVRVKIFLVDEIYMLSNGYFNIQDVFYNHRNRYLALSLLCMLVLPLILCMLLYLMISRSKKKIETLLFEKTEGIE